MKKKILIVILAFCLVFSNNYAFSNASSMTENIKFTKDGAFLYKSDKIELRFKYKKLAYRTFTGEITVKNISKELLEDWNFSFYHKTKVISSDKCTVSRISKNRYEFKPKKKFKEIKSGESIVLKYKGSKRGYTIGLPMKYDFKGRFQKKDEIDETDKIDEQEFEKDTDSDGLPDYIEKIIGTDINNPDTDGDGLNDKDDLMIGDPLKPDSHLDTDGDGLDNLTEIKIGTDVFKKDTDGDGLSDYDEYINHKTNPLKKDTDGDFVSDFEEIKNGTDPNKKDSFGDGVEDGERVYYIERDAEITESQNDNVSLKVQIGLQGKHIDSFSAKSISKNDILFPSTTSGYLGAGFDLNVKGSFEFATLNFTYKNSNNISDDDFEPAIYYIDEEKQNLELVHGQYHDKENKTVRVSVSHFSKYVLLNRPQVEKSIANANYYKNYFKKVNNLNFALVPISSVKDEMFLKKNIMFAELNKFKSDLQNGDNAGVMYGVPDLIGTQEEDENLEITGIDHVVIICQDPKYLDSEYTKYNINGNRSASIIQIGNDFPVAEFKNFAMKNKGFYFNAESLNEISKELEKMYELQLDKKRDTDGDGISDYFEKNGEILLGGEIRLNYKSQDTDGDGLKDSEEIFLVESKINELEESNQSYYPSYIKMLSNPSFEDSDFDGMPDGVIDYDSKKVEKDPAPFDNFYVASIKENTSFLGNVVNFIQRKRDKYYSFFKVDYRMFFGDKKVYNNELSRLGMLLSTDIYDETYVNELRTAGVKIDMPKDEKVKTLYEKFGLKDIENIVLKKENYKHNKDDITEFNIGHRLIKFKNESKEIIFITIRGTNTSNEEWSSNFDIGYDDGIYYDKLGYKPAEWKNKKNHKGFDVTKNRVMNEINDYIKKYNLTNSRKTFFVNGHSRGGAIANLLGKDFYDNGQEAFVYTFGSPTTTQEKSTRNIGIFNIVNKLDLITLIPLKSMQFTRYGIDVFLKNTNEEKKKISSYLNHVLSKFEKVLESRKKTYEFKYYIDEEKYFIDDKKEYDKCVRELKDSKFLKFSKIFRKKNKIKIIFSRVVALQNLANLASRFEWSTLSRYNYYKIHHLDEDLFINFVQMRLRNMLYPHEKESYINKI